MYLFTISIILFSFSWAIYWKYFRRSISVYFTNSGGRR